MLKKYGRQICPAVRTVTSPSLKVRCRALGGQNSTISVPGGIGRFCLDIRNQTLALPQWMSAGTANRASSCVFEP